MHIVAGKKEDKKYVFFTTKKNIPSPPLMENIGKEELAAQLRKVPGRESSCAAIQSWITPRVCTIQQVLSNSK